MSHSFAPSLSPITARGLLGLLAGLLALGLAAHGLAPSASAQGACTVNWDGEAGDGLWQTAKNWDTNAVPGPNDHICIPTGTSVILSSTTAQSVASLTSGSPLTIAQSATLAIDSASTIDSNFTLSGTLAGDGNLDIQGLFTWTGGQMMSSGTTDTSTSARGGMRIEGAETKSLRRDLLNYTAGIWTGGDIQMGNVGAADVDFINYGIFDIQTDAGLGDSREAFVFNSGTITKSAGAGTTTVGSGVVLFNDGTVRATSGTLKIQGETEAFAANENVFAAPDPGRIEFAGGSVLRIGPGQTMSIQGTGVRLTGGRVEGDGTLEILGKLTWFSGMMARGATGAGVTRVTVGTLELNFERVQLLDGRQLIIGSQTELVVKGAGNLLANNGVVIDNYGTFDYQSDADLGWSGGAKPVFNNHGTGTLTKSSGTVGTTFFGPQVTVNNNGGTISATYGTLSLQSDPGQGGGISSTGGTLTATGGGVLEFTSNARLTVTGTTSVAGTGVRLNPGSVVDGDGTLSVAGTLYWTGGTMTGAGITDITPGGTLAISGTNHKTLDSRRLTNAGRVTWEGTGSVRLGGGTLVRNLPGANVEIQNDGILDVLGDGTSPLFDNQGTVRKGSGGLNRVGATATGTTTIRARFQNQGTVEVQTGTVYFVALVNYSGSTLSGGIWIVFATLQLGGGLATNAADLQLDGSGSQVLDQFGGNALAALTTNTGSLALKNGRNLTTNGAVTNAGSLAIGPGSTLTIGGGGGYTQTGGSTVVDGTLAASGQVDLQGGSLSGSGTINANLRNAGQVSPGASPGLLTVTGSYTQTSTGALNIELGGLAAGTQFDQLSVGGPATLDGTLNVSLTNGFVPNLGNSFAFLPYASRAGDWATKNLPPPVSGREFQLSFGPTAASLVVVATPLNANTSFEADANADGTPDGWARLNLAPADALVPDPHTGSRAFLINGTAGAAKALYQVVNRGGAAGEQFVLYGWSKASGASPTGGFYVVGVRFNHTDGTMSQFGAAFGKSTHDWQEAAATLTAPRAFSSMVVAAVYQNQTGSATFDDVTLSTAPAALARVTAGATRLDDLALTLP